MSQTITSDKAVEIKIKQQIIAKITEQVKKNRVPNIWQLQTLSTITGEKLPKAAKRALTINELKTAVKNSFYMSVFNKFDLMSFQEIKEFIKNPSVYDVLEQIKNIKFAVPAHGEEKELELIDGLLKKLSEVQLWSYLESVTKFVYSTWLAQEDKKAAAKAAKKKKQEKSSGSGKSNYISIPNNEAKQIIASYYSSLASGASVTTPECFRSAGLSNPSTVLKRFIYTHYNQEHCKEANSINENVYKIWKSKEPEFTLEQANDIETNFFKSVQPDFMEKIDSWKDATYIVGCIKKN